MKTKKFILAPLIFFALHAKASLSYTAETFNTIQGTPPKFAIDNTPIDSVLDLLWMSYIGTDGQIKYATPESAIKNEVLVVKNTMTWGDIKTLVDITADGKEEEISTILQKNGTRLTILDQNGDAEKGAMTIGKIKVTPLQNGAKPIAFPNGRFAKCNTEYGIKVEIIPVPGDSGKVSVLTNYGDPNRQDYVYPDDKYGSEPISSVTYRIRGDGFESDTICDVKSVVPKITTPGYQNADESSWKGTILGFVPSTKFRNFPATGFNKAAFTMDFNSVIADKIIANSSPYAVNGESNISLTITKNSPTRITITLNGPFSIKKMPTSAEPAILPATFELKTDDHLVYSFTIDKWFIPPYAKASLPNAVPNYAATLTLVEATEVCQNLAPNNAYRIPDLPELTNGPYAVLDGNSLPDSPPITGTATTFRQVGPFLSEWGAVSDTGYPGSNFTPSGFLSRQTKGFIQYTVHATYADVKGNTKDGIIGTGIPVCVSNN